MSVQDKYQAFYWGVAGYPIGTFQIGRSTARTEEEVYEYNKGKAIRDHIESHNQLLSACQYAANWLRDLLEDENPDGFEDAIAPINAAIDKAMTFRNRETTP